MRDGDERIERYIYRVKRTGWRRTYGWERRGERVGEKRRDVDGDGDWAGRERVTWGEILRERCGVMRKYRNGKSFQTLCRWKSFYTSSERNAKTMTRSLSSRPGPYDSHQSARSPSFTLSHPDQCIYYIYICNYM